MSINYCRNCKLLYRDTQLCTCGRRLNSTSEELLSKYQESGYRFAEQESQKMEESASKPDALSFKEMFDRNRIIAQYEEERLKEQEKKVQEIQENKKKSEDEIDAMRRRFLNGEREVPAAFVSTQMTASAKQQIQPGSNRPPAGKNLDVKAFFEQLGLEKKC